MLISKKILLIGGLGLVTALTGCESWHHSSDRTQGRMIDDHHITSNVQTALRDEPVYKFNDIDVKTYDGVVQLSGFVNTDEQKQRAGEIAQHVSGVQNVVNNISLKPQQPTQPTGRTDQYGTEPTPAPTAPPTNSTPR